MGAATQRSPTRVALTQSLALTRKNWMQLGHHWIVNALRCLVFPIAFMAFLCYAKELLGSTADLSPRQPAPIQTLSEALGSKPLYYVMNTTSTSSPSAGSDIIAALTQQLSESQRPQVTEVADERALAFACPQSFAGRSRCFGGFALTSISPRSDSGLGGANTPTAYNYTLLFDAGLRYVDDAKNKILPLQRALDLAIIQVSAGISAEAARAIATPLEQPFSHQTNAEKDEEKRRDFLDAIPSFTVLAFGIAFLGVTFHLPAEVATERGSGMADLLTSMGCSQAARLFAWLAGPAASYMPAYFVMAAINTQTLWVKTNAAITIAVYVLPALAMAAWSLFLAVFFKRSNLSGIVVTGLAIIFFILGLVTNDNGNGSVTAIGLVFPPASVIYAFTIASKFEAFGVPINLVDSPRDESGVEIIKSKLIGQFVVNIIGIIVWPLLAAFVERKLYYRSSRRGAKAKAKARAAAAEQAYPAVKVEDLHVVYGKKSKAVTAVRGLSFEVEHGGLFCFVGGNGCGKSSTMAAISGTTQVKSGEILIDGWERGSAPPGTLGLCPQKNILFDELSAYAHVRLFHAIKHRGSSEESTRETHEQLLRHVELGHKLKARPTQMSGGMKRKLQLAIALAGDSSVVLVDEATSGLDPHARRSIWKILLQQRRKRTILYTTHALDEVDVLASDVIILGAPGIQLARGSPIQLRQTLGAADGTVIHVTLPEDRSSGDDVEALVSSVAPDSHRITAPSPNEISIRVPSQDAATIQQILDELEKHKSKLGLLAYDVAGPDLEHIFLRLHAVHERENGRETDLPLDEKGDLLVTEKHDSIRLSNGSNAPWYTLAFAQLLKRFNIFKRGAWLGPVLAIAVAILGSILPQIFFINDRNPSCNLPASLARRNQPQSYFIGAPSLSVELTQGGVLFAPENSFEANLGPGFPLNQSLVRPLSVEAFAQRIATDYQAVDFGGVAFAAGQPPRFAYFLEEVEYETTVSLLNVVSNAQLRQAAGVTGAAASPIIFPTYRKIASVIVLGGLGDALKWAVVFGLAMAVWPAFATLYPTREKTSGAKAMALSNGQRVMPLWLGHLGWELWIIVVCTAPVIGSYGSIYFNESPIFAAPGLLWLSLFLYGIAATLQAFIVSLFAPSALAAFALCAAYNAICFLIFFAATLLTITYYVGGDLQSALDVVFYITGLLSPAVSAARAGFVSVNLFSVLCDGRGGNTNSSLGAVRLLGGPILYIILWILVAIGVLYWRDSSQFRFGSLLARLRGRKAQTNDDETRSYPIGRTTTDETARVEAATNEDMLRVRHLTKRYGKFTAVDDVTFGVQRDETFALLGPNGAGKTTALSVIRGETSMNSGAVEIGGVDLQQHRNQARAKLGSVPQHDGLDDTLSVEEHLRYYAIVKGIARSEREADVESVLSSCKLEQYRHRAAGALSGGNKRKLSMGLSILGCPSTLILDELSSGVDAATARSLWSVLSKIGTGRSIVLCTHNMVEVAALARRLAIQATRLLAVGNIAALRTLYPVYELSLDLDGQADYQTVDEFVKRCIPEAKRSDLGARYEIPLGDGLSVAGLFAKLNVDKEARAQAGVRGWQLGPLTLEGLFLRIVRDSGALGEDEKERDA